MNYGNTSGVKQLRQGATQWRDLKGNATSAPKPGLMDRIASVAPYAILAGLGYGAMSSFAGPALGLAGGGGSVAGDVAGVESAIYGGGHAAAAAAAAAGTGAATKGAALALSPRDWLDMGMFGGREISNLVGTNREIAAGDRAAASQLQASREQLALVREMYNKDQANLEPYYALGRQSVGQLGPALAGMRAPGPAPQRQRVGTMANYQRTVPLTAPDGSTRMVPSASVPMFRQRWAAMTPQGAR